MNAFNPASEGGPDFRSASQPASVTFDENAIFWSMRNLPVTEACKHLLVCGTIGSGKTMAIRLFLQSIARRFRSDWKTPEQLVLFDAKGDAIPLLAAMGLRPTDDNVSILNPFDQRSRVWNIGEAVDCPAMARHLATLLVPEERYSNAPYFTDAARELVYAVILALHQTCGANWSLRDLLCALDSRDHLAAVAAREPRAKILAQRILHDNHHSDGILSTLGTKLGRFEQVAALWHASRNPQRFSIREFLQRPGVLILGTDPVLQDDVWPINAILLKALSQEILRGPETLQPRHWFVFDEFPTMGRVDCIHDLLNRGRSKGASVLLGISNVADLARLYGAEHTANEILGQCGYKTFLRLGDPRTALWAENFIGRVRGTVPVLNESWSRGKRRVSPQYSSQDRSLLIGSYFLTLPFPVSGGPYVAVCDVPCYNSILIVKRPFNEVLSWCLPPTIDPALERFSDPGAQRLRPWTPDERQRFCGTQPAATTGQPAPAGRRPKAGEWKFTASEIKNLIALCRRLLRRSDPVSACLVNRLSQGTQQAISAYLVGRFEGLALGVALVAELGAIVAGPSIYDRKRFAEVQLRRETLDLLQHTPPGADAEQLNRMLLEDAFPGELARRPKHPRC